MERTKLTTQKLHSIIRKCIKVKCSRFSISAKIDRQTYDILTGIGGCYGVFSCKYLSDIIGALKDAGIKFDDSNKERGFIKVAVFQ